jgi:phage-related protein
LSWANISETDSDTLETFFEARASDGEAFSWTPPDSATSYKFICASWNKTIPYNNRATIHATFTQVFEP